jgi:hypothetical protein
MPDCPRWSDDRDEHECPGCFVGIEGVVREAAEGSLRAPPNRGDFAKWHREAFKRSVPLAYYAGGYRQEDRNRPCLGVNVGVGGIAGAPFQIVLPEMADLSDYIRNLAQDIELGWESLPSQNRAMAIAALVGESVARFVRVHPFVNGNGRTSRILWTALLARFGLPQPCSIVRRPGDPYGALMDAAMRGDARPMVLAVLRGLAGAREPGRPVAGT